MSLLIKNAHLVRADSITKADVFIEQGVIVQIAPSLERNADKVLEADGKYLFAGFIDMHTHLRIPGREDEETIESGSYAAAKGGFTTIMCMPNTQPAIDEYEIAKWIKDESERLGIVDVIPVGSITKERKGEILSEFGGLKQAGCIAVSDDGASVKNSYILRRAFEYAKLFNLLLISHCEDRELAQDGIVRESYLTAQKGIPAYPEIAETVFVLRDIEIARYLHSRIHIAHVSSKRSLEIIRQAKKEGILVTCETCPHYFSLNLDVFQSSFSSRYKVNPPLGTKEDMEALRVALKDGTIDCITTDHAPHTYLEKEVDLYEAAFGFIGLEFALPLTLRLVRENALALEDIARLLSLKPAQILGLEKKGDIQEGYVADLCIVDLEKKWPVSLESIVSKSKNTPFLGETMQGCVVHTIHKGVVLDFPQKL